MRPRVVVPVKPCDNVPIFSWLELRGRCRSCAAAIIDVERGTQGGPTGE